MWKMMLSPLLWAGLGLGCVMFAAPDRAAAARDAQQSSAAPANADSTAAAPVRDPRLKSEHRGDPQSTRTGAQPSAGSKGRNSAAAPRRAFETPQRGMHPSSSANADRLKALMNMQARGHSARQTGRPLGTRGAMAGGGGLRRPGSMGAAGVPTLAAAKRNALPAPKLTMVPRNPALGGPHLQSGGRLGGTIMGGANRSAAIDGAQVRRKF
jgi:hypothetical protein